MPFIIQSQALSIVFVYGSPSVRKLGLVSSLLRLSWATVWATLYKPEVMACTRLFAEECQGNASKPRLKAYSNSASTAISWWLPHLKITLQYAKLQFEVQLLSPYMPLEVRGTPKKGATLFNLFLTVILQGFRDTPLNLGVILPPPKIWEAYGLTRVDFLHPSSAPRLFSHPMWPSWGWGFLPKA